MDQALELLKILAQNNTLLFFCFIVFAVIYLGPLAVQVFMILQLKDFLNGITRELQELKEAVKSISGIDIDLNHFRRGA